MASRELPSALRRLISRDARPTATHLSRNWRRYASTEAAAVQEASEDFQDLESQSSLTSSTSQDEKIKTYDPVKRAQGRRRELPPSRYEIMSIKLAA